MFVRRFHSRPRLLGTCAPPFRYVLLLLRTGIATPTVQTESRGARAQPGAVRRNPHLRPSSRSASCPPICIRNARASPQTSLKKPTVGASRKQPRVREPGFLRFSRRAWACVTVPVFPYAPTNASGGQSSPSGPHSPSKPPSELSQEPRGAWLPHTNSAGLARRTSYFPKPNLPRGQRSGCWVTHERIRPETAALKEESQPAGVADLARVPCPEAGEAGCLQRPLWAAETAQHGS